MILELAFRCEVPNEIFVDICGPKLSILTAHHYCLKNRVQAFRAAYRNLRWKRVSIFARSHLLKSIDQRPVVLTSNGIQSLVIQFIQCAALEEQIISASV